MQKQIRYKSMRTAHTHRPSEGRASSGQRESCRWIWYDWMWPNERARGCDTNGNYQLITSQHRQRHKVQQNIYNVFAVCGDESNKINDSHGTRTITVTCTGARIAYKLISNQIFERDTVFAEATTAEMYARPSSAYVWAASTQYVTIEISYCNRRLNFDIWNSLHEVYDSQSIRQPTATERMKWSELWPQWGGQIRQQFTLNTFWMR